MLPYVEKIRLYNEERRLATGRQPLALTHHFGCQQNVADGEKLDGMLAEMGYAFTGGTRGADLVLYNTCAVRENAEDRIFGNVGALKHEKAQNPELVVGLCGCMVQQEHMAEKFRKSYPYVDLLFGPSALHKFPELLWRRLEQGGKVYEILDATGEIAEDLPVRRMGKVKAFVPIMYGCDNFCSYCVVPYVRGRERSRDHGRVLAEIADLIREGYKDITLLGQNVNSYHSGDVDFVNLLRMANGLPGDFRLRFMTSHPKDCSRELIDAIADCDKVAKYLHLPVQSGSDRVLAQMNRRYTVESYREKIRYARERIPGIALTSDIIVGFPGETYEDVKATIALIEEVGYQSLFTFVYSKRQGTRAAAMEDPVSPEEKGQWFRELLNIQNEISKQQYEGQVGKVIKVLADGPGKSGEGWLTGRSDSNMIVDFQAPAGLDGSFVKVKITEALHWALAGELV